MYELNHVIYKFHFWSSNVSELFVLEEESGEPRSAPKLIHESIWTVEEPVTFPTTSIYGSVISFCKVWTVQ